MIHDCLFTVITINIPYLNGNSFSSLILYSCNDSFGTTRIYLELRPNTSDGLVLDNGQSNGTDYISLTLSSGIIQFQYDLGSGPAVIESRYILDLNEWHTIEAWRTGWSGVLIVNGIVTRGTSQGTDGLLRLGEPLYLGGIPGIVNVRGNISTLTASETCELVPLMIHFIVDSSDDLNITECPSMDTCANQPCINGGTCVQEVNELFHMLMS